MPKLLWAGMTVALVLVGCSNDRSDTASTTSTAVTAVSVDADRFCDLMAQSESVPPLEEMTVEEVEDAVDQLLALMAEAVRVAPDETRAAVETSAAATAAFAELLRDADFDRSRIDQADIDALATDDLIASGFALEGWTAENCSDDGPNEDTEEDLSHPAAVAEAIDQLILQAAEEFGVDYGEEDYEILTAVVVGDCAVIEADEAGLREWTVFRPSSTPPHPATRASICDRGTRLRA